MNHPLKGVSLVHGWTPLNILKPSERHKSTSTLTERAWPLRPATPRGPLGGVEAGRVGSGSGQPGAAERMLRAAAYFGVGNLVHAHLIIYNE